MTAGHGECTFDYKTFTPPDPKAHKLVVGNVMWIEREKGLAYRVGVGQIHIEAWAMAQPEKSRVLLA